MSRAVLSRLRDLMVVLPLLAGWTLPLTTSRAAVIHVPGDQPTIQAGIDAADPGDTVLVGPGTYTGDGNRNLSFGGKNLVLLSQAGAGETILDGSYEDARGFLLDGGETEAAVIDGFTVRNFWFLYGAEPYLDGAGMLILSGNPTVRNCVFEQNQAQTGNGGGAYASGGRFESCVFRNNTCGGFDVAGWGGGIYAANAAVVDCRIEGNIASDWQGGPMDGVGGGAVLIDSNLEGSIVVNNQASIAAGVYVSCTSNEPYIYRSTIANNYSDKPGAAGGLVVFREGVPTSFIVQQTIIWGNGYCGNPEIALDDADLHVNFICSLLDSSAVVGDGDAVYGPHCVYEDPLFCDAKDCNGDPGSADNYNLLPESPARAENSPCHGLIGASDDPCEPTGIGEPSLARRSILGPPTPNPARSEVRCAVHLAGPATVAVEVFDVGGRLLRTLVRGSAPGAFQSVVWDLRDEEGAEVPAGFYLLRLRQPDRSESRGVVVLR